MAETKNLCAQIPLELHAKVCGEREQREQTTSQYITELLIKQSRLVCQTDRQTPDLTARKRKGDYTATRPHVGCCRSSIPWDCSGPQKTRNGRMSLAKSHQPVMTAGP